MNSDFYHNLTSFNNFDDFDKASNYKTLPDGWTIFVADIENSTHAIEQGRYKDVNLIGAAVISFCLKAITEIEFPYVFGGDGASLCIPNLYCEVIEKELGELKSFCLKKYKLKLRVSKIPLQVITDAGFSVQVAKYELIKGRSIAFFKGGGIDYADYIGKCKHDIYAVAKIDTERFLDGLSCRWQPIPTLKGVVLSLLIKSKTDRKSHLYSQIVDKINVVTKGSYNPVNHEVMTYKSFLQGLSDDSKMNSNIFSKNYFARLIQYLASYFSFTFKSDKLFESQKYAKSINLHSDYRKFDDTLKMIIDCTIDQKNEIKSYLCSLKADIYYGIHESDSAMMTCFVESINEGGHIHFIDGSDGGYAMAALELKKQMQQL